MTLGLLTILSLPLAAQTSAPGNSNSVAEIDAGIGPCTADFTINDQNGSPIYNAKIRVHLTYGWMNLHKLDMEAGTNSVGKARFIGLPDHPKEGLFFTAALDDRHVSAFDDPNKNCKAVFTLRLERNLAEAPKK
jgi:hypothetical protein